MYLVGNVGLSPYFPITISLCRIYKKKLQKYVEK